IRKGFRSSRGAMRGTIGGAPILPGIVGFATVAIGVGPFVSLIYALVRIPCLRFLTGPSFDLDPSFEQTTESLLAVCGNLFGTNHIRIAAGDRAEVQKLLAVAHGNGERLVYMHAANRIAYQPSRQIRSLRVTGTIRAVLLYSGALQKRTENAAKQPSAPRD